MNTASFTPLLLGLVLASCASGHRRGPSTAAAEQHGGHYHRRFESAEEWSRVFDDPARDAWQRPAEVVATLRVPPDALVADIGAGTGYFASRLARAVPRGRVFAVDIEEDMVRHLAERARREGLGNITPVQGSSSRPNLPGLVDLAIVVDTYHHIPERVGYFSRLREHLRAQGRVAIIDFTRESPMGPPVEHRIAPDRVREELAAAGFRLVDTHVYLPNQFFLVFEAAR
jgi:SAM-dependent methyltransferase